MAKSLREFQVFAKPVGPLCNLECCYCYYIDTQASPASVGALRMPEKVLERYIAQHIEASSGETIAFSWHGGEPTLLGLDYFRTAISLQRKYLPHGKRIFNGMQTNGLLIDEEWSQFLASEGFSVGLSMDGPPELHDCYRVTRAGEPTHARVLRTFKLLQQKRIACDILCAVHNRNVRHPLAVYRFFKEIGCRFISFLPIVNKRLDSNSGVEPHSVPSEDYGEFLCSIFDEWTRRDIALISVQIFEEAIRPLQGHEHSLCIFRETCGNIPVIERNGDFFSCDHFVDNAHRIGNILDTHFLQLLESREQKAFGSSKKDSLPCYCRQCEVLDMCNGGCPKDRFLLTPEGEHGLNYLCAGFKHFFTHSRSFFQKVIAASKAHQTDDKEVRRNDPCPCGSGRKYKRCCIDKGKKAELRSQD